MEGLLYIHPSICLLIHLSTPSINPFISPSNCPSVPPCIHPSVRLSVCLSVQPSLCPSMHLSIHSPISLRLSIYPAFFLSIHPPINPFIHPSIYPPIIFDAMKEGVYVITILTVSPANGLLSPKNSLNTSSASPWNVYPLTKSGVARTKSNYLSMLLETYSIQYIKIIDLCLGAHYAVWTV